MNLHVIIPAAHNFDLTCRAQAAAWTNVALPTTRVDVFDNGVGFGELGSGENVGNYPVFWGALAQTDFEILCFIHNDVIIHEPGFDARLMDVFEADPLLGLVGWVASNEVDFSGGRGLGTVSNFQGLEAGTSAAEVHGARDSGFRASAIVDGCAMVFRREALEVVPEDPAFPPHHFYDKKISMELLYRGWHVGYLGVAFDHLNGQTACVFQGYRDLAKAWCEAHGVYRDVAGENWDHQVYLEAEAQFLAEWRDEKRFFPLKVGPDHAIYHLHPRGRA